MHLNMSLNDLRCKNRISGHSDGHACMHVAMPYMRARAPCLFWARGPQFGATPPGSLGGTMGHLLRNRRARGALFWSIAAWALAVPKRAISSFGVAGNP